MDIFGSRPDKCPKCEAKWTKEGQRFFCIGAKAYSTPEVKSLDDKDPIMHILTQLLDTQEHMPHHKPGCRSKFEHLHSVCSKCGFTFDEHTKDDSKVMESLNNTLTSLEDQNG